MSTEISPRRTVRRHSAPEAVAIPWDGPDPEAAFERLRTRPGAFWLDSSLRGGDSGRFSIAGCEPFGIFRSNGAAYEWRLAGRAPEVSRGDPLARLENLMSTYRVSDDVHRPVPFCCGAVGAFSYDGDLHLGWYDSAAVWDHAAGRAWLVGAGWRRGARKAAEELGRMLEGAGAAPPVPAPSGSPEFLSDFTRETFKAAVGRVRERIAAGEIYQMNLSQRFRCPLREPPADLYRRLRKLNPAPMGAYLDLGDCAVLSSSPERFISVDRSDQRIRTFPIKGTRPRGRTELEDAELARELLASPKERAELLMIVDLLRNDLGRVCEFGSVQVRRLYALESFATVHHLVGEVEGRLRPNTGWAEILRAVFPGGSITGAPKIQAMRVIAVEEPVPRGLFSGSIGYLSACGRADLNIAIRTIECRDGTASFHVGAGIVWDSDPDSEYEETLAKGRALFAALGGEGPDD